MTLRVFIGYGDRQPLSYQVLHHSIVARASELVVITPLMLKTLPPVTRRSTSFTFSRFLVPYLGGFEGFELFLDSDTVVSGDVAGLFRQEKDGDWLAPIDAVANALRERIDAHQRPV